MAKKSRVTKNKHKDFQKVRLKAGLTKGGAKRQADSTKRLPFVKTRRVELKSDLKHVPQRFHSGSDFNDRLAGEKNSLALLIDGLDHANEGMRKHCLAQLHKLLQTQLAHPTDSSASTFEREKAEIIRKSARNLVDPSASVSEGASKLLCLLCACGGTSMIPFCPVILSFIAVALTTRQHDYLKTVKHALRLLHKLLLAVFTDNNCAVTSGGGTDIHSRVIATCGDQWMTVLKGLLSVACLKSDGSSSSHNHHEHNDKICLNACSQNCSDAVENVRLFVSCVFGSKTGPNVFAAKKKLDAVQCQDNISKRKQSAGFAKPLLLTNVIFEPPVHDFSLASTGNITSCTVDRKGDTSSDIVRATTSSSSSTYQNEVLLIVLDKLGVLTNLLSKQCRGATSTSFSHRNLPCATPTDVFEPSRRPANDFGSRKAKKMPRADDAADTADSAEYECLFKFFDMFENIIVHLASKRNDDDTATTLPYTYFSPTAVDCLYRHVISFLKCVSESDVLVYNAPVEKDPLLVERLIELCDLLEESADSLCSRMCMQFKDGGDAARAKNKTTNLQKRELLMTMLQTIRKQQGRKVQMSGSSSKSGHDVGEAVNVTNLYRSLLRRSSDAEIEQQPTSCFARMCGMTTLRYAVPLQYLEFDKAVRRGLEHHQ